MDTQQYVNHLCMLVRLETIEFLVKEDRVKCGAMPLTEEELGVFKRLAYRLPCSTRKFRDLFDDAHKMQREQGMFPHPVSVIEMEWCLKNRYIGMFQREKQSWLPKPDDKDLRRLPAFSKLDTFYRKIKKALPPIDKAAIANEATAIINNLAIELKRNG